MGGFLAFLDQTDRKVVWTGCLATVLLLGWLNVLIGWEISFSVLYLIPVGVGAWVLGRAAGLLLAILSMFGWYLGNRAVPVDPAWIVYWNTFVRFLFFIIVARLLADLKAALTRERELARIDPLTGLANTRAFAEVAMREIARARRTGRPLALACIDLNRFKAINDELGHAAGDSMLMMVGAALKSSTRKSDLPSRLGGDEFAVLLPETDQEGAEIILRKVVDKVESYAVVEGRHASVSAGAVVSISPPGLDDLLRHADRLMYEVKRSGENRSRIETIDNDRD